MASKFIDVLCVTYVDKPNMSGFDQSVRPSVVHAAWTAYNLRGGLLWSTRLLTALWAPPDRLRTDGSPPVRSSLMERSWVVLTMTREPLQIRLRIGSTGLHTQRTQRRRHEQSSSPMVRFTLITVSAMATLSNAGDSMLFEEHVPKIEGKLDTVHDTAATMSASILIRPDTWRASYSRPMTRSRLT